MLRVIVKLTSVILFLLNFSQYSLAAETDLNTPLNFTQMRGTHNSYHIRRSVIYLPGWNYTHPPINIQLNDYKINSFELDIHVSYDKDELEVYHIYAFDDKSNCKKFVACLQQIKKYSDSNPYHKPIFVWLEIKDIAGGRPFDHFELLENNIKNYLGDRIVIPDKLQGDAASLKEAIRQSGWPSLKQLLGRIFFILHSTNNAHAKEYTHNFTSLNGRLMFAKAKSHQRHKPWALFTHAQAQQIQEIAELKRRGFIVITTGCLAKMSAEKCEKARVAASKSGATIIKQDSW